MTGFNELKEVLRELPISPWPPSSRVKQAKVFHVTKRNLRDQRLVEAGDGTRRQYLNPTRMASAVKTVPAEAAQAKGVETGPTDLSASERWQVGRCLWSTTLS